MPSYTPGVREFQSDFETPGSVLTQASTVLRPDAISLDHLTAFSKGPVAIEDLSSGLEARTWYARATTSQLFIARSNAGNTAWEAEVELTWGAGGTYTVLDPPIVEIDLAFDSDGRPVIVMERGTGVSGAPQLWVYFYDPFFSTYSFHMIGGGSGVPGRTPRCVLDLFPNSSDPDICPPESTVQLVYFKPGVGLMRREQTDRFVTEYVSTLVTDENLYLEEIFPTSDRRLSVIYSERNLATGKYVLKRLNSLPYRDNLLVVPFPLGPTSDIFWDQGQFWRNPGSQITDGHFMRWGFSGLVNGMEFGCASTDFSAATGWQEQETDSVALGFPSSGSYIDGFFDFPVTLTHGGNSMSPRAFRARTFRIIDGETCYSPWAYWFAGNQAIDLTATPGAVDPVAHTQEYTFDSATGKIHLLYLAVGGALTELFVQGPVTRTIQQVFDPGIGGGWITAFRVAARNREDNISFSDGAGTYTFDLWSAIGVESSSGTSLGGIPGFTPPGQSPQSFPANPATGIGFSLYFPGWEAVDHVSALTPPSFPLPVTYEGTYSDGGVDILVPIADPTIEAREYAGGIATIDAGVSTLEFDTVIARLQRTHVFGVVLLDRIELIASPVVEEPCFSTDYDCQTDPAAVDCDASLATAAPFAFRNADVLTVFDELEDECIPVGTPECLPEQYGEGHQYGGPGLIYGQCLVGVIQPGTAHAEANSTMSQTGHVGTAVPIPPSVLVLDEFGDPAPGVTVSFAVTAGGGSCSPASVITGMDGIATLTEWILGPTEGINTLTATVPGYAGSPIVFVAEGTPVFVPPPEPPPPTLVSIIVLPVDISIQSGNTQQYTANGVYSDASVAPVSPVWSVDIGSISLGGLFTAGAAGAGTVTATIGAVVGTTDVTVTAPPPPPPPPPTLESLSISPTSAGLYVGGTQQFVVQGHYSDGSTVASPPVVWTATGGTVTTSGLYTAGGAAGSFLVTATSGAISVSAPITLTVPDPPPAPPPGGLFDGLAELPRVTPAYVYSPPTTGVSHFPDNAAELNTLLTGGVLDGLTLARGDIIELIAGVVYTSSTHRQQTFPALAGTADLADSETLVYVRTINHASLPAYGRRVSDADVVNMPIFRQQLGGGTPPILFAAGATGYVFVGFHADGGSVTTTSRIVEVGNGSPASLSAMPDKIVFDRCHVTTVRSNASRRCFALHCREVIFHGCHGWNEPSPGVEDQAIWGGCFKGPMLIYNSFLVAGAENVMFGGSDPFIAGTNPLDITIRRSHLFKPLRWNPLDPSFDGSGGTVKNLFELKKGIRILIEDTIMENFWVAGQIYSVNLKSVNQSGGDPTAETSDVTMRYVWMKNVATGFTVNGQDGFPGASGSRMSFHNLLFTGLGSPLLMSSFAGSLLRGQVHGIYFRHITAIWAAGSTNTSTITPDAAGKFTGFKWENSVFSRVGFGIKADATSEGTASLNAVYASDMSFAGNGFIGANSAIYPTGNQFPVSVAAAGLNTTTGRLNPGSPLLGTGIGGVDPGCDIDALEARISGCVSGIWP